MKKNLRRRINFENVCGKNYSETKWTTEVVDCLQENKINTVSIGTTFYMIQNPHNLLLLD